MLLIDAAPPHSLSFRTFILHLSAFFFENTKGRLWPSSRAPSRNFWARRPSPLRHHSCQRPSCSSSSFSSSSSSFFFFFSRFRQRKRKRLVTQATTLKQGAEKGASSLQHVGSRTARSRPREMQRSKKLLLASLVGWT